MFQSRNPTFSSCERFEELLYRETVDQSGSLLNLEQPAAFLQLILNLLWSSLMQAYTLYLLDITWVSLSYLRYVEMSMGW